jgi:hypothetical protein
VQPDRPRLPKSVQSQPSKPSIKELLTPRRHIRSSQAGQKISQWNQIVLCGNEITKLGFRRHGFGFASQEGIARSFLALS